MKKSEEALGKGSLKRILWLTEKDYRLWATCMRTSENWGENRRPRAPTSLSLSSLQSWPPPHSVPASLLAPPRPWPPPLSLLLRSHPSLTQAWVLFPPQTLFFFRWRPHSQGPKFPCPSPALSHLNNGTSAHRDCEAKYIGAVFSSSLALTSSPSARTAGPVPQIDLIWPLLTALQLQGQVRPPPSRLWTKAAARERASLPPFLTSRTL